MLREVIEFNVMIGNAVKEKPQLLTEKEAEWLYSALQEEADEFMSAVEDGDLAKTVDALIDSLYFTIGGLHRLGLSAEKMEQAFALIHNANMTKKRGVVAKRANDGSLPDAVKPEGWKDPVEAIRELLHVG